MAMASNRPKDFIDYLMTGRGDPNMANAPYDPILQNINTPRPSDAPAIEIPVPIKSKPAAPYSRRVEKQAPLPTVTRPMEMEAKSKVAKLPKLDWGQVDILSKKAEEQSKSASIEMQKGVKDIKEAKRTELPTPTYKEELEPFKQELPKYEKEVDKAVGVISDKIGEFDNILKSYQSQEDALRANYKNAVEPLELEMKQLSTNPPDLKDIDQGRYWRDKSTGNKVLLGISLALSALTQQGIENASRIVTDAINRDIDAQKQDNIYRKERYESTKTGKQNLLNYYLNKYKDETTAINAARAASLSAALGKVQMVTQGLTNKQSVLNAQKLMAELQTNATKYATDAITEKRKIEDAKLTNDLIAVAKGVESINDVAKMELERAKLKETELSDRAKLEILAQENNLKMKEQMPVIFSDKYANAIERMIPSKDAKNKQAHEQLGTLREQYQVKKNIRDYFLKAMEIGPFGSGKGFLTDREVLRDAELTIFPTIKSIMGERFTDSDKAALVDPLLPSRMTSKEALQERLRAIEKSLSMKVGDTSIVDSLGFRKIMDQEFEDAYRKDREIRGK